jgi:glycosyltransferase involved in cell wall biosynthesis
MKSQCGRIIVFVAGERVCGETAVATARQLYGDFEFVFVCEPVHCRWLSPPADANVFVVDQPFNPFGRKASELLRLLNAAPIEACALVVAECGFESLRFRIFALRLQPRRFILLSGNAPGLAKQVGRLSFALLAGATFLRSRLQRLQHRMVAPHKFVRRYRTLLTESAPAMNRKLMQLTRPCSGVLLPTGAKRTFKAAFALCGIKYLDAQYRRIFQRLLNDNWQRWFGSKVSAGPITLVIGTLGPGGSERQVVTTALGLAARGCSDLALVCASLATPVERFYAYLLEGCPISVSEISADCRPATAEAEQKLASAGLDLLTSRLPPELKDITWYTREFLARRPRVVHSWLDYVNVRAGLAAAIIGVPRIILSTRSVAPDNFALFQPYMRQAYRLLAAHPNVCLLNNSEAGARDYEEWLGLSYGTFKVIRNGFDFSVLEREQNIVQAQEFRARVGIPRDVPVVGSVLRFSEEKGPLLWIDVAARIAERRPDAMFLMVGDGPLWEAARQRAQACGIGDRIIMIGHEKNAAVAMTAMDLFLLTSRLEGLPNVLIEAQALGVPVVTTDAGGATEALLEGKTGYAISPHSAERLADAVLNILGDAAWRMSAKEAAQTFVRERFSMSQMIENTLSAYFAPWQFSGEIGSTLKKPEALEAVS